MAQRIKQGDLVVVITGEDKGKTGKVLRVIKDENRLIVEGIKRVWKHVKPKAQGQQGSRIQKNSPIHVSNVAAVDPAFPVPDADLPSLEVAVLDAESSGLRDCPGRSSSPGVPTWQEGASRTRPTSTQVPTGSRCRAPCA